MRNVEWNSRNGPVCHSMYTPEEAKEVGIVYKENWREGVKGDWVLTDDGWVVEVLRGGQDAAGRRWVGTATMTTSVEARSGLDTNPRENRYSFNGKGRNPPKHLTTDLLAFCQRIARLEDPVDAYLATVGKNSKGGYSPQYLTYVRNRIKRLMNRADVKEQIKSNIDELMKQAGISHLWILQRYKAAAEQTENFSAAVSALNKLTDLSGLKGRDDNNLLPPVSEAKIAAYTDISDADVEDANTTSEGQKQLPEPEEPIVEVDISRAKLYAGTTSEPIMAEGE